ncbi:MAG: NAD(P)H-dependent oxidoreductase [Myxococcales bacterium]|nr:NAD(P)H-dependent oxidoreductase [Myxococcales bacterium]
MAKLKLVGLSGSLRKASHNTALLHTVQQRLAGGSLLGEPVDAELTIIDYREVPFYDDDLGRPASVEQLDAALRGADGVILATPEYNYGIPGVLKNAIDWASRPAYKSAFYQRPVGIVGASGGAIGTARAQGQLKQVLLGMASQVFPYPEFNLGGAGQRIQNGELTDAASLEFLDKYLLAFTQWVDRVKLQ